MTVSHSHSNNQQTRSHRSRRSGLTLVEIMIALTMTLIVLGAMMSAFRYASEKMALGRAVMEMANRARVAEEFLRSDLANLTLDPRPHTESTAANGFLEIIEGVNHDSTYLNDSTVVVPPTGTVSGQTGFYGDIDDLIGMTSRSAGSQKFRGLIGGSAEESTMAEIWYFTRVVHKINPGTLDYEDVVELHRRVLLIRPDFATPSGLTPAEVNAFIQSNDLSVRVVSSVDGSGNTVFNLIPNSIADLAVRQNRYAHGIAAFPNLQTAAGLGSRLKVEGGDVLLTDLAAFDVRVYSPNVSIQNKGTILVEPHDPGYVIGAAGNSVGGFVDLGWSGTAGNNNNSWFSGLGSSKSQLSRIYDTWSPFYEFDGIDQDGDSLVDEGTNGLDDGGTSAFDDDVERETRPPYPYPLRGIKVSLRLIEKNTQQIHQTSVIQSYVPE